MIELYISAVVFGLLTAAIIHTVVSKRQDRKMLLNIAEKIEKQDNTFVIDGKRMDLLGDIKRGHATQGVPVKIPKPPKPIKPPKKPKELKAKKVIKKKVKKKVKKKK